MSLFHKTISDLHKHLMEVKENKSASAASKMNKLIIKHMKECRKELRESEELHDLLEQYFSHLSSAHEKVSKMNSAKVTAVKKDLINANNLVLELEHNTRKLYGDEHKLLKV